MRDALENTGASARLFPAGSSLCTLWIRPATTTVRGQLRVNRCPARDRGDGNRVGRGTHDAGRHTKVTSCSVAGGYKGESE
jgi:hypothetical protein